MPDNTQQAPKIYVLHENDEWVEPLAEAFRQQGLPYEFWFINEDTLDLNTTPPEGIFYNRMSASAHTRDHRYAIELAEPVVAWLEQHGRRVVNGRHALTLEVRKAEQCLALQASGIPVPDTVVANNYRDLIQQAAHFPHKPFLVKPNRGGKGAGVQLFQDAEDLRQQLSQGQAGIASLDGIMLLQQYASPASGHIVRLEFIGGQFYYAVQVDASGGFELCPADQCEPGEAAAAQAASPGSNGFRILKDYQDAAIPRYEEFLARNGIEVGAIEYTEDAVGERFVYDVNINTNYNAAAETAAGAGYSGMGRIAAFLGRELKQLTMADPG